MDEYLDPVNIQMRESRDSEQNPNSTPIIVALDVTASMGFIAAAIAKEHLGTLVDNILERKPVPDPHLMFMGFTDAVALSSGTLQVTQFEADTTIIEQLTKIWLAGGGGGNDFESYDLPWAFAAKKTVHDRWEKRGKKGYLFTIGDELFPEKAHADFIKKTCGEFQSYSPEDTLKAAQETYEVFHVIINEGSYARGHKSQCLKSWQDKLGWRALPLNDHTYLTQAIVTAMDIMEGADAVNAIAAWEDAEVTRQLEHTFQMQTVQ
jgi:hypothetical protein